MRLHVRHDTTFRFAAPVKGLIQALRLYPRNHEGQHVAAWRIDIDANCRLKASEDAFGNRLHIFDCEGPIETLAIQVVGEVEIFDTAGILREAAERLPPELFLRDTHLTSADPTLRDFAETAVGGESEALTKLHMLMDLMHATFELLPGASPGMKVGEVVERQKGAPADLAHAFIAAARHFGIPARCVGGYCLDLQANGNHADGLASAQSVSLHVWAEAHIAGLGWIGFDPSCGFCPRDTHVRVAMGLDRLGAAPIRCARNNGCTEKVDSRIVVSTA